MPWSPLGVQFLTGWIDENTTYATGDIRGIEPRFAPENITHNMQLITLIKEWATRKNTVPAQIALAWLMAQKPWTVPIPGTTNLDHMYQNSHAAYIHFSDDEINELNTAVAAIEIKGTRLPESVLVHSGREAPLKG